MYAKFKKKKKQIIVYIGNAQLVLKRAKNNGGMVRDTAISITKALNRVLDWVEQNDNTPNGSEISDYYYLCSKLIIWASALNENTIKNKVCEIIKHELTEDGEVYNAYSAKQKYFTDVMDTFVKDARVIDIIDNYTYHNSVDNIEDNNNQEARLSSYDVYTLSMLFTFTRLYYVAYLTVMDVGEYTSMISKSLLGDADTDGLADLLSQHTIVHHYPKYLGASEKKFVDRFIYQYLSPYIDNKSKSDATILEKFSIAGINKYYVYQKVISEMFSGLHRIVGSEEINSASDNKDDYDADLGMNPSDRKFYFKKITRYLSESLNRILNNVIGNFKPSYSMKVEGSDMNAEKDVFDAHVNENKENAEYVYMIKDDLVKDAIAGIRSSTLKIGESVTITRHILGKFVISVYLNYRYGIAEPVNFLTLKEYRACILFIYDKLGEDYNDLRLALLGKIYSGINNACVELKDFKKLGYDDVPPFLAQNIHKSLNTLTNLVKSRYLTEITFQDKTSSFSSDVKNDLLRFLCNVDEIFGEYREER